MNPHPPFLVSGKKEPSQLAFRIPAGGQVHFYDCGVLLVFFVLVGLDCAAREAAHWMTWLGCRTPSSAFALFLASHQAYNSVTTLIRPLPVQYLGLFILVFRSEMAP